MVRSDRFLVGIVAAVVALVLVAFLVAIRQEPPTYRTDAGPDAVAFNYLLALQNGDYELAYGLIAPTVAGYPDTIERFVDDIVEKTGGASPGGLGTSSFRVEPGNVAGERAVVTVVESSFRSSDLFDSNAYTQDFVVTLAQIDGVWRVQDTDAWQYWHPCWSEPDNEYCGRRDHDAPEPPPAVAP